MGTKCFPIPASKREGNPRVFVSQKQTALNLFERILLQRSGIDQHLLFFKISATVFRLNVSFSCPGALVSCQWDLGGSVCRLSDSYPDWLVCRLSFFHLFLFCSLFENLFESIWHFSNYDEWLIWSKQSNRQSVSQSVCVFVRSAVKGQPASHVHEIGKREAANGNMKTSRKRENSTTIGEEEDLERRKFLDPYS